MELREIIQRSKSRPEVYAPALAVEALNLRAEVESLRSTISRLREYADHKITCGTLSADYFVEKQGCDCGYDELMKELGVAK